MIFALTQPKSFFPLVLLAFCFSAPAVFITISTTVPRIVLGTRGLILLTHQATGTHVTLLTPPSSFRKPDLGLRRVQDLDSPPTKAKGIHHVCPFVYPFTLSKTWVKQVKR